jgi:hypothetical protein
MAFCLNGRDYYYNIVFGKDKMDLNGKIPPAKCQGVTEESDDLVVAVVIARQRTVTRNVPGDRWVECLEDRWDVTFGKVVIPLTDDSSVGRNHDSSSVDTGSANSISEKISQAETWYTLNLNQETCAPPQ